MHGIFTGLKWEEVSFSEVHDGGKLARATITNRYEGGIEAEGKLEYLLVYRPGKPVTFSGLERVHILAGQPGTLVLAHEGIFSAKHGVVGSIHVVEGMGTGRFAGIVGAGRIAAQPGEHTGRYVLIIQHGPEQNDL